MLNEKPVFIVALTRGGSSLLLNILRSHPDLCSPRGETHEVFVGKSNESLSTRMAKLRAYLPVVALQREHVFSRRKLVQRRPPSVKAAAIIDRILHRDKLLAMADTQNRFRSEGIEYTREQIQASRLLSKNIDGLAFVTPLLAEMYPDAAFFGLVRHGLAVCEAHMRRGKDAAAAGRLYRAACGQMADDAERMENFHLLRYDDITTDTLAMAADIYARAKLDREKVKKFRLVVGKGDHTGGEASQLRWFTPEEFKKVMKPNLDEEQIAKLSRRDRNAFLREAGEVMERLGYR